MNEGYAIAKLLAHCLEKEIGEVGIFKRLLEVREARFIPRMTLQLYCSAILQSLNRVQQLSERQYRSLVQRIVRCKTGNDTALVIIDIAWIHSGEAYVQNGEAKQKHIMSHRLGEIFGIILDGLCYPEPNTIVNLPSTSPSSHELVQVMSDRMFAKWGLMLSQPEFIVLLAGRLRGIPEANQLEYLNQVMNEVMNRPPKSLSDFRVILDNLRPQNTWDLN